MRDLSAGDPASSANGRNDRGHRTQAATSINAIQRHVTDPFHSRVSWGVIHERVT